MDGSGGPYASAMPGCGVGVPRLFVDFGSADKDASEKLVLFGIEMLHIAVGDIIVKFVFFLLFDLFSLRPPSLY